jgi:hypothetical protein
VLEWRWPACDGPPKMSPPDAAPQARADRKDEHAADGPDSRRDAVLMPGEDVPPSDPRREALMVWLKLLALLVMVGAFGFLMLHLSQAIRTR